MHSCSIIMAAGSHGSSFYGGGRLRPMTDLSSSNAVHGQQRHGRSVGRDLHDNKGGFPNDLASKEVRRQPSLFVARLRLHPTA